MGTENDLLLQEKVRVRTESFGTTSSTMERIVRTILLLGFMLVLITEAWLVVQVLDIYF
jgi:hypothetical protein